MRYPVPSTLDIGGAIEAARAEVVSAGRVLTDRANDVFRVTAAVATEAVQRQVDGFVLGQPERTAALGKSGVERLRGDLTAAVAKLPAETAKRLVTSFSWTFPQEPAWVGDNDRVRLFEGGSELPWMIDDTLRALSATSGRLVAEAGFEILPPSYWELGGGGAVQRYLGPLAAPSKLIIALRSYSDARLRYFRALRAKRRLEAEKSLHEARIDAEVERESALQPATTLWTPVSESG